MSTGNLKEQINVLVKLQELDSEIYALENEKAAKPQELEALTASFEAKKQGLVEIEKLSLQAQKLRKEKELELAANTEAIKKLQGQIFSLKTNKEFQAMQQQIADKQADSAVIEEKILISLEESDKIKIRIEEENLKLKNEEKIFSEQKNKANERLKEISGRLSQLNTQRAQIIPDVDSKILREYERILHSRGGLAIAPVKDNSCGGCNMLLPPQVINLIKMYAETITCQTCNRILYINE